MQTSAMAGLTLLLASSCTNKRDNSTDTSGLSDTTDGGSGWTPTDDTDTDETVNGMISGTVRLQLYTETDGIREYLDWDETYGEYPFGSVFIAAYTEGASGDRGYPGTTAIGYADLDLVDGSPYEIPIKLSQPTPLRVYAAVDYWRDGILGSSEPEGRYPAEITLEHEDVFDGADITVLVPYYDFSQKGGGGCETISITGDIYLDRPYDGGQVSVMLVDTAGVGPYEYAHTTLQSDTAADTAAGAYSLATCRNQGSMQLRGVWDANNNHLIDPADLWGSYMDADGEDANPITVGASDMSGYDIAIPLGGAGLSVIPFTEVSGTLQMEDDAGFDDLPESTTAIYVVALKYSPSQDMSIDDLYKYAYDVVAITPERYAGRSSISFSLGVPADSVLYLWAYADTDGNGTVNASGEPVGSGGGSGGRILTTEGTNGGNDITLGVVGS